MSVSTVDNTPTASKKYPRIEALRKKHRELSQQVEDARKQLSTTDYYLNQLKKQKLIVKEKLLFEESRAAN
ncbi:MAG: DUF465 domain-containing protein [Alphaproteobacteria bacterium]|nr:DUF465 domain-containing protein [Alphaproteobacteria bacterium]